MMCSRPCILCLNIVECPRCHTKTEPNNQTATSIGTTEEATKPWVLPVAPAYQPTPPARDWVSRDVARGL